MKIKILFFGRLASLTKTESFEVECQKSECKVEDIRSIVFDQFPELRQQIFRIAVNREIVIDSSSVRDGDEIALLPPISGGAPSYLTREEITPEYVREISQIEYPGCGSALIFQGKVRKDELASENNDQRHVVEIEYSAYYEMAEREIEKIVSAAKREFKLAGVILKHRIGNVKLGEPAFLVAVFSPHRKESIRGIDFIIDEVKSRVPIWKKEIYSDGSEIWKEEALISS